MARLESPEIPQVPSLTGLPVTVKGDRCAAEWYRAAFPEAWRGFAVASEPVLALAFAASAAGVRWVKSGPAWGNAVAIEIVHGPYAAWHDAHVRLDSLVWPPVREARDWEEASRRAQGVVPADGEIQVPDGYGHHTLQARGQGIEDPSTWPLQRMEGETGRLLPLLHLEGASPIRLDLLVLPRRALRVGRCRIWKLKPRYRDAVPEPLRHVLSFGRAGSWPPQRWPNQRYGGTPRTPRGSSGS